MMRYVFSQSPCTVGVQLSPGADAASVLWELRGNNGLVIESGANPNLVTDNATAVVVSSLHNTIVAPTETRFVLFNWTLGAQPFSAMQVYTLTPFLPLRVQPQDVRSAMGLNLAELPDDDIDIQTAAMEVQADVTPAVFNAAIVAGDLSTTQINRMVAYWAGAKFASSLSLRIVESMGNEQSKFNRYGTVDLRGLVASLRGEYERLRNLVTGIADADVVQPTLFSRGKVGFDTIRGPASWSNYPGWSPYFRR